MNTSTGVGASYGPVYGVPNAAQRLFNSCSGWSLFTGNFASLGASVIGTFHTTAGALSSAIGGPLPAILVNYPSTVTIYRDFSGNTYVSVPPIFVGPQPPGINFPPTIYVCGSSGSGSGGTGGGATGYKPGPVGPFHLQGTNMNSDTGTVGTVHHGDHGEGWGEGGECSIDSDTYWAVQRYLSQYHGCPGCLGGQCGCKGPWGNRFLRGLGSMNGALGVPWFLQPRRRQGFVYSTRATLGPRMQFLGAGPDVYASLTAAQQQAVNAALFAFISQPGGCPAIFTSTATPASQGINSAADLNDAGNRSSAVDCFQQGYNATNSTTLGAVNGPGVLDAQTYQALIGQPAPINPVPPPQPQPTPSGTTTGTSTGTVIAVGAVAVAGGVLLAYALTRPKTPALATHRRYTRRRYAQR
jgi:hypothetical protein